MSDVNIANQIANDNAYATFNKGKAKGQSAGGGGESWFEALADAWGSAMNKQADKITDLSKMVQGAGDAADATKQAAQAKLDAAVTPGEKADARAELNAATSGSDQPSVMVKLSAESMKMSFMANSESTSMSSTAQALETMAKKG